MRVVGHAGLVNPGTELSREAVAAFEAERPRLLGLAYRMLGVYAEAEDVVQETWLRWNASTVELERPPAWLTTVATRIALDRLRAGKRRREDYVGPWIAEPVVLEPGPEETAELSDSLTLGFLTMLDRLSPVERAVFLLADVFEVPYCDVATTVDKSEVACRQIASRARRRLRDGHADAVGRHHAGADRRIVDELLLAVVTGDVARTLALLAPDVVSISDGGANRHAARRPVVGADRVARFFTNLASKNLHRASATAATINGDPGVIVTVDGAVDFVAAFEVENEKVVSIWIVRNPEKLEHVLAPVALR